ncbi:MAG: hypothetical protein VX938_01690, partial [Myxococcota bacterium]|nr:hypothetical protein [Myxococcota bacterium]
MTSRLFAGLWFVCVLSGVAIAAAQPASYKLDGHGGLEVQIPAEPAHPWKMVKQDDVLLVLERPPVPDKGLPFGLLIVASEQGPETTKGIDWKRIKDNIITAAGKSGSDLA